MATISPEFRYQLDVHWEDTDAAGIVYYANYLKFMERARSTMVAQAGIDQRQLLQQQGIMFPVRHLAIDYLRPAQLADRLTVITQIKKIGGARLNLNQSVYRGKETLTTADVGLACVLKNGKPCRIPAEIRSALFTLTYDRKKI